MLLTADARSFLVLLRNVHSSIASIHFESFLSLTSSTLRKKIWGIAMTRINTYWPYCCIASEIPYNFSIGWQHPAIIICSLFVSWIVFRLSFLLLLTLSIWEPSRSCCDLSESEEAEHSQSRWEQKGMNSDSRVILEFSLVKSIECYSTICNSLLREGYLIREWI